MISSSVDVNNKSKPKSNATIKRDFKNMGLDIDDSFHEKQITDSEHLNQVVKED